MNTKMYFEKGHKIFSTSNPEFAHSIIRDLCDKFDKKKYEKLNYEFKKAIEMAKK